MNIYALAKLANVSTSTVSKVMNGKDGVGKATRERVLQIIEENGYKPKIAVNMTNNIAVIFRQEYLSIFDSEFMKKILKGICEYTFEHEYNILLHPLNRVPKEKKEFTVYCYQQRIAGCIFLNLKEDDYFVENISGTVPIVSINAVFKGDKLYSVTSDDKEGFYNATQYLYRMGHKRIAVAVMGLMYKSHKDRLAGYKQAMTDLVGEVDNDMLLNFDYYTESKFKMIFESLRNLGKMPTAIMFFNDQEAQQAMETIEAMGIKVPDNISIVGYDDYDFSSYLNPPLTTVRQVLYEKGIMAARLVDAENTSAGEKMDYVFKTELVIRRTVKFIE